MFFFYFLGRSIASQFASQTADLQIVLSRTALPEDVADRVAIEVGASEEAGTQEYLQSLLKRLARAGATEGRRTTQVRENAGLIVMALLRAYTGSDQGGRDIDGCTVRSVVFPGSHLTDVTLRRCSLLDVTIRRTDLASTRFLDCEARNVLLVEPRVTTDYTRLELKGIEPAQVMGIQIPLGGRMETSYDPSIITATLKECGAPIRTNQQRGPQVSADYVMLLEHLMRAYRRSNPVCKGDPNLSGMFEHPDWLTIERLLVTHGVVEREQRSTSGKRKEFLRRRFRPEQIMAGLSEEIAADQRIRAFWRALEVVSEPAADG